MNGDPVEEFQTAIAEEQRLHAPTATEADVATANEHAAQWASAVRRVAGIATQHGPALLARLRAAESAMPKWRKATEEDRKAAKHGKEFLVAIRYKHPLGWGRWEREVSHLVDADADHGDAWIADLPPAPPEPQP